MYQFSFITRGNNERSRPPSLYRFLPPSVLFLILSQWDSCSSFLILPVLPVVFVSLMTYDRSERSLSASVFSLLFFLHSAPFNCLSLPFVCLSIEFLFLSHALFVFSLNAFLLVFSVFAPNSFLFFSLSLCLTLSFVCLCFHSLSHFPIFNVSRFSSNR